MRRLIAVLLTMTMVAVSCGSDGDEELIEDVVEDASGTSDSGDDGGSDSSTATIDVRTCEVVTADDLADQGFVVEGEPALFEDTAIESCTYTGADAAGALYVTYSPPTDGQGAISDAEEIDGLGEGAIYSEGARSLSVTLSDGGMITIATVAEVGDLREFLIALAETALSRI